MVLNAGEKLGPYEVTAPLGKGGMSEVYRATDRSLRRDVEIKVSVEKFSNWFEHQGRAVAALNHPNFCTRMLCCIFAIVSLAPVLGMAEDNWPGFRGADAGEWRQVQTCPFGRMSKRGRISRGGLRSRV